MTAPRTRVAQHYSSMTRGSAVSTLWRSRELLLSLVARDLKVKYQRSVLGLVWTLLNPIMMVLVLVTVFSYVIRIRVDSFWAFLISGFFVWRFISQSLTSSTLILRGHATLRRSVAFPSEVLILSTLFAKLFEYLIEMAIVLLVLFVFYHQAVPATVILLPYLILLQILMTAGLMFPLSVFSVLYYDVEHTLPLVILMFFYLTPIFYPVTMIPEVVRPYYYLNPFVGLFRLFHMVLYEGVWPSWTQLGLVSATAIGLVVVGYWIFKQFKDVCVEVA